jgi:hypothetical protein
MVSPPVLIMVPTLLTCPDAVDPLIFSPFRFRVPFMVKAPAPGITVNVSARVIVPAIVAESKELLLLVRSPVPFAVKVFVPPEMRVPRVRSPFELMVIVPVPVVVIVPRVKSAVAVIVRLRFPTLRLPTVPFAPVTAGAVAMAASVPALPVRLTLPVRSAGLSATFTLKAVRFVPAARVPAVTVTVVAVRTLFRVAVPEVLFTAKVPAVAAAPKFKPWLVPPLRVIF